MLQAEGNAMSRILRARMTVRGPSGQRREIVVALDPCSSVNLVLHDLAHDIKPSTNTLLVKNCGGSTTFRDESRVFFCKPNGTEHQEQAYVANATHLPSGCHVLLSLESIDRMRVDMNYHVLASKQAFIPRLRSRPISIAPGFHSSTKTTPVGGDECRDMPHLRQDDPALSDSSDESDAGEPSEPDTMEEVHLSEQQFKNFNDRTENKPAGKDMSYLQVDVNPALPQLIRQTCLQIFEEYQDVFAPHTGEPPVLLTGEPYRITFKPGYRPRFCPKPK